MVRKHTSVGTTPDFRGTGVPFSGSNRTLEQKVDCAGPQSADFTRAKKGELDERELARSRH